MTAVLQQLEKLYCRYFTFHRAFSFAKTNKLNWTNGHILFYMIKATTRNFYVVLILPVPVDLSSQALESI